MRNFLIILVIYFYKKNLKKNNNFNIDNYVNTNSMWIITKNFIHKKPFPISNGMLSSWKVLMKEKIV